jgi:hypothetical protein
MPLKRAYVELGLAPPNRSPDSSTGKSATPRRARIPPSDMDAYRYESVRLPKADIGWRAAALPLAAQLLGLEETGVMPAQRKRDEEPHSIPL